MSEENKDLGDMADDAMDNVNDGAENLSDKAGDALDSAKETASELGEKASEKFDDAKDAASDALDSAKETASELGEKAGEKFDDAKEAASDFADEAKKTANEFTESAKETFGAVNGENKKILAGILAIVLGSLGVHKFILGYKKEGIILLAATLVGYATMCFVIGSFIVMATAIVGLIEGIIYLTKSDEEFMATYQEGRKPWF